MYEPRHPLPYLINSSFSSLITFAQIKDYVSIALQTTVITMSQVFDVIRHLLDYFFSRISVLALEDMTAAKKCFEYRARETQMAVETT